jgi:hypothetical protein
MCIFKEIIFLPFKKKCNLVGEMEKIIVQFLNLQNVRICVEYTYNLVILQY